MKRSWTQRQNEVHVVPSHTADGFDPLPLLPTEDPDNMLGFNSRELRLADRVREMQEQNTMLRHQLAAAHSQLVAVLDKPDKKDNLTSDEKFFGVNRDVCTGGTGGRGWGEVDGGGGRDWTSFVCSSIVSMRVVAIHSDNSHDAPVYIGRILNLGAFVV